MLQNLCILISGATLSINIITLIMISTVIFHEKKEIKEDDK